MSTSNVILPLLTNRTLQGPRITYDKERLLVAYDYEDDRGTTQWAEVIFTETLFYQFFDSSCCKADHVMSAKEIRRQDESELLAAVISGWNEAVGWQEWQQQKGGSSRFAHFTVYFDDAGAVDVVASGCDVACR